MAVGTRQHRSLRLRGESVTEVIQTEHSEVEASLHDVGLSTYHSPAEDVCLALDVAGLDELRELDTFAHLEKESLRFALEELSSDVIAPSDPPGDLVGAKFEMQAGKIVSCGDHRALSRLSPTNRFGR